MTLNDMYMDLENRKAKLNEFEKILLGEVEKLRNQRNDISKIQLMMLGGEHEKNKEN